MVVLLVSPAITNLLTPDAAVPVAAVPVVVVAVAVMVLPAVSTCTSLVSLPVASTVRVVLLKFAKAKDVSLVEATGLLFDINRKSRLLPAYP